MLHIYSERKHLQKKVISMAEKQINSILHFHAASVGEVTCAFRVIKCLKGNGSLEDKFVLLTYTSNSVESFIKKDKQAEEWKEEWKEEWEDLRKTLDIMERYKICNSDRIISKLDKVRKENSIAKMLLIIMEKDRQPGLLKYYEKHGGRIYNFEAKPPQSVINKLYEQYISNSLNRIDFFLCENENYENDILRYIGDNEENKAKIKVTGTIKGSIDKTNKISSIDGVVNIAYISVRPEEITALAKIINELRGVNRTIRHIIIPRYVEPSLAWPPKDINRFVAKIRKKVGTIIVVKEYDELTKTLDDIECGIIIFQEMGEVLNVLNNIHVSVVCGSLCHGSKGHNVFEPLSRNIPTIIGTEYINWNYTMERMKKEGILISKNPKEIHTEIERLLLDPSHYEGISKKINDSRYFKDNLQPTREAADCINKFFK